MTWLNQLEPKGLLQAFGEMPPDSFRLLGHEQILAFFMRFHLLTTMEDKARARIQRLPLYARWAKWLSINTAFVGTTVSEYVPFSAVLLPEYFIELLQQQISPLCKITIIKDIPQSSPLLSEMENDYADAVIKSAVKQGYIVVEGQALAYVPVDFDSIESYLAQLSYSRRKNLRRKLKSRNDVIVTVIPTGRFYNEIDERVTREYYDLYEEVYSQSEIHFDHLTYDFICQLLRDNNSNGIVFEYRRRSDNLLIGWNLCYAFRGNLIDKYIGLRYPHARELNLYFLSWIVNLEYALQHGLKHYIAGWTDPEVKASLGAKFTFTRHAVYIRSPLLRTLIRRFSNSFEGDRSKLDART
ncbi:peptidogalycan biosysnthesis protein [Serratia marcescens]|uniref:peptidogalycan biosysnthesis protein n=1 Tax=Serratia marcescens TaxID=615 RepID=UPI0009B55772|nr:peptidogalycan biosysnthesis protein [Serratia marcescens]